MDIGQKQDNAMKILITCWSIARNLVMFVKMENMDKMDKVRKFNKVKTRAVPKDQAIFLFYKSY